MIFIDIHDNPNNIAKETDITLCLANFNSENINSLAGITFYIEEKLYKISFCIRDKIKNFPYKCSIIANTNTSFKNFSKASKFIIKRKSGRIELVTHDYNSVDKVMLLGGKWRKEENV